MINLKSILLGAFSGMGSTLIFTIIHNIFISNIWFMLMPMLIAGALCGSLLIWSYLSLVVIPSKRNWLVYNWIYVAFLVFLGVVSVLYFEPVTTMAAVVMLNGPPTALIDQAMPMTIVFTLGMAITITLLYDRSIIKFFAVLLTCIVLVALLGMNISAIGLVDIPSGSLLVIAELFGLVVVLNAVYVMVYLMLDRWMGQTSTSVRISVMGRD
ncbi:MAG: hypothetical protein ACK2U1_16270 [Anaerolineales bacterium]|jgi:hypothetical protein